MMFEIHRARFLKASELLHELTILQQVRGGHQLVQGSLAGSGPAPEVLQAILDRLRMGGLVTNKAGPGGEALELSRTGEQQLRVLMVDYMHELVLLHREMTEIFTKKLADFYLDGIRRVAFYPVGDTAEVVHLALQTSGLVLKLTVDDDPLLWGSSFHEVPIKSPDALIGADVDGIILTTSVFETQIRLRLEAMSAVEAKVLSLW